MTPRIAVIPGHNTSDRGARNGPYRELDFCRMVCDRVREHHGIGWPAWTKYDNYPEYGNMASRIRWLNDQPLDAVIEVHLNSSHDARVNYPCVLRTTDDTALSLANQLATSLMSTGFATEELCSSPSRIDRPAFVWTEEDVGDGVKRMLRDVEHPVALTEAAFLSADRFIGWIGRNGIGHFVDRYATAINEGVARWVRTAG